MFPVILCYHQYKVKSQIILLYREKEPGLLTWSGGDVSCSEQFSCPGAPWRGVTRIILWAEQSRGAPEDTFINMLCMGPDQFSVLGCKIASPAPAQFSTAQTPLSLLSLHIMPLLCTWRTSCRNSAHILWQPSGMTARLLFSPPHAVFIHAVCLRNPAMLKKGWLREMEATTNADKQPTCSHSAFMPCGGLSLVRFSNVTVPTGFKTVVWAAADSDASAALDLMKQQFCICS